MARPSARPKMIDAALAVVAEHGVAALTLDAAADRAGVTKRGLIYHFPTKRALLIGIHEELAARMERQMLADAGRSPEEATLVERTRGYVRTALKAPSHVEMLLVMEAAHDPELRAPWEKVYLRWFPESAEPVEALDDLSMRCLVARMAADGSWGYDAIGAEPLAPAARERLTAAILRGLEDA